MTFLEMRSIEKVLLENKEVNTRAKKLFFETMKEKYGEWFETKMNDEEKNVWERVCSDQIEARRTYETFVNYNWK